jgi:hypothetical protein
VVGRPGGEKAEGGGIGLLEVSSPELVVVPRVGASCAGPLHLSAPASSFSLKTLLGAQECCPLPCSLHSGVMDRHEIARVCVACDMDTPLDHCHHQEGVQPTIGPGRSLV